MNPLQHSFIVGLTLAGLFAFEARASADAGDIARADYARARTAVQQFEDAAREALSAFGGNGTPEAIANARRMGLAAREALARCRRAIDIATINGALGDYSAPLLRQYEAELERDCAEAEALLPEAPAPEPGPGPAEPAPAPPIRTAPLTPPVAPVPADGPETRPVATLTDEEIARELEAYAKEVEEAHALAENTFGYHTCPRTLQEAFDRLGVKLDYAGTWGQSIWLGLMNTYGRMPHAAGALRRCASQFRGNPAAASRPYAGYLRAFMGPWRADRERFFGLARRIVETQAQHAQALERGRAAGKFSFENEEAIQLSKDVKALYAEVQDPELLRAPLTFEEWNRGR